jgi:DNA-binding CsgD family transcriptional regulator
MSSVQPVGRTSELIRLGEALDRLGRGGPVRLAVEGEPGIGKTFLLSELRRRAEERGHLVLAGSGSEFENDFPFGVWVDALDAYVASQELDTHGLVEEALISDLAGVLPSLRRGAQGAASAGADERYRSHRAVRGLLEVLADRRPLVLVLDDLHWSDPASAELIAALLRRAVAAPVLLALAYRSGREPAKLASALAVPGVVIIELGELSAEDSSTLAGEGLSAARRAAIFRQGGGNPFYTLELARAAQLPTSSSPAEPMAGAAGVPRTVAAALLDEFESLSPMARALLDAGAIAGDPFDPDLADSVAEFTRQEGMLALDELLDARLLQATDVPRRFAFRHPLIRRAVYDATKGGWRIGAHGRAAAALAERGAPAAARAYHVEQSASLGDVDAIGLLLEAGEGSAAHAPAAAARWYEAALRLMPEDDRPTRLPALMSLARVLGLTGDLERSATRLREAIALVPEGELTLRLRLTSACATCENFLGHHDRAKERLSVALAALPDERSHEAVAAQLDLAAGAFFTFEQDWMCQLTSRALQTARTLGEPSLIGAAAAAAAHATALIGLVDEAESAATEAGAMLDQLPDALFADHLVAVNRLSWAEFLIERYSDSIRHAQRGVTVARATGRNQFVPLILQAQALSTMVLGDLPAAGTLQDDALEVAELAANGYVTCSVLTTTGTVAMQRGDDARGLRASESSVALVQGAGGGRIPTMARVRLAITRRELGASAADTEALVAAAGGWELPRIPPTWRALWAETLTRVELAAGRTDEAEACARLAEVTAANFALPLTTTLAQRARARMLHSAGAGEAARELALRAAVGAERAGASVEAARARAVAGLASASVEDRDAAIRVLREAEACFDRCGAERDRAEARRELRKVGARWEPRGRASTAPGGLDALSQRERQVAMLVTARKTNREVAADLFLSEKTVESHLRNIFAKLGASSRVEVARAVERDGLPDA